MPPPGGARLWESPAGANFGFRAGSAPTGRYIRLTDRTKATLVLNAGSSSIKFSLYDVAQAAEERPLAKGVIEGIGRSPRLKAEIAGAPGDCGQTWADGAGLGHSFFYDVLLDWIGESLPHVELAVAGHRVVHGGTAFDAPQLVNAGVMAALEALVPLAPLHQPHNLAAIKALSERDARLPQVACFDTAFHRTIPNRDQLYGLPRAMAQEGLRRYGFHGLSYEFIAWTLPKFDAFASTGRAIVAHLGNGASLCAFRNGRSQLCTMGFSTLDGLIMGTRCGSIDPGVLIYLMREKGMGPDDLEALLYKESGLLGLSGISSDMRDLLDGNSAEGRESVAMFCDRVAQQAASLVAALGGVDALVFTAGIGEHSPVVRKEICRRLEWLGLVVDDEANAANSARINARESSIGIWVIPTDEELMIARHSRALVTETQDFAALR